ncbi:MAG: hypothetical protein V4713_03880 [Pseudomonadota bacterium]
MPTIFLDANGLVMAVFLRSQDATEYASISNHKYCAMPFNVDNHENTPLPQVGDIYKV